jgi:hypothetical protein
MTMYEEPPIVDIDEILDEQDEAEARATRNQILLVVAGGIVGIAGLLTVLVVTAPSWLELVRIIGTLTAPGGGTP